MHTRLPIPAVATLLFAFAPALPAQQTPANNGAKTDEEVIVLEEFQVTTTAENDNYIATDTVGTRTAAKLTETPFSIQSLTSEFINDFQLFELADQLNFVAGAFSGAEDTGANNGKSIRGFSPPVLRDGFSEASPPNRSLIDRVEIIRGPASALFGQAEPGGIVNYVSKRPVRKPKYQLQGIYGPDYDFARAALTAGGPVIPGKLFYFANFSYDYSESDTEFFYNKKYVYAGALAWALTPRTLITLALEKQTANSNQGDVIPLYREAVNGVQTYTRRAMEYATFNLMGPYNYLERDFECGNILIEHRFTPDLVARANLQTYKKSFTEQQYRLGSNYITPTSTRYNVEPYYQDQDSSANHFGVDLNWRVRTGPVRHSFLVVGDYHLSKSRNITYVQPGPQTYQSIDMANPEWIPIDPYKITQVFQDNDREKESYGVLFSHRGFFFRDRLVTLAGIRYDEVRAPVFTRYQNTTAARDNPNTVSGSGSKDNATTYMLGANIKLYAEAIVLFANLSTGFTATNAIDQGTGELQPNERSKGVEAGFKGNLLGNQLNYTLSAYKIKKDGISVTNPDYITGSTVPQYLGSGVDKAQGVEADMRWNITKNFFMQSGAGYVDSQTESTAITPNPDRIIKSPRVNAYGAVRHTFRDGPLKGLKFGASVSYRGDYLHTRASYNSNGVRTRFREEYPSVTLWGGFVGYSWKTGKKWSHSLAANGLNLFNKNYVQDTARLARGREIRVSYTLSY